MKMGSNPINLLLRFLLELAALFSYGCWGWNAGDRWFRYLLMILAPLVGAMVWGTFTVPNDPSRSGKAPVPVPGWLRLILELTIFGFACLALAVSGLGVFAWILGVLVLFHYGFSVDRIHWLLAVNENNDPSITKKKQTQV